MTDCRPAEIDDLEILEELIKTALAEVAGQRGGELYLLTEIRQNFVGLADELEDTKSRIVVGTYDSAVVGWGMASEIQISDDRKIGKIKELFVQSEARGVGVGEAIVSALIEWIQQQGCAGVEGTALPGNRDSKGIFERFGIKTRMLTLYKDLDT